MGQYFLWKVLCWTIKHIRWKIDAVVAYHRILSLYFAIAARSGAIHLLFAIALRSRTILFAIATRSRAIRLLSHDRCVHQDD